MKIGSTYSLSIESKKSVYKSFIFYYNTLNSFPIIKPKFLSFKHQIINYLFIDKECFTQDFLIRALILYENNFFSYLNIGKKFTQSRPKLKINVTYSSKEFLFVLSNFSLKEISLFKTIKILQQFYYHSLKINSFFTFQIDKWIFSSLKKLIYLKSVLVYKFLFFDKTLNLYSFIQKKINFYQFNLFFKNFKNSNS